MNKEGEAIYYNKDNVLRYKDNKCQHLHIFDKQLCVLQFSAFETLHVMVNIWQINMTKQIIMKLCNCIKYVIFLKD